MPDIVGLKSALGTLAVLLSIFSQRLQYVKPQLQGHWSILGYRHMCRLTVFHVERLHIPATPGEKAISKSKSKANAKGVSETPIYAINCLVHLS